MSAWVQRCLLKFIHVCSQAEESKVVTNFPAVSSSVKATNEFGLWPQV